MRGDFLKRETVEKYQVLLYLTAIAGGLVLGMYSPASTNILQAALWPFLGILLYTTFTQIPLLQLRQAFSSTRFLVAAIVGNFIVLPLIVWGLMQFAPNDPAVRLGILLVLLVPCTDWFITFTHLGGGDTRHAIALSPVSLLLQLLLLPFYLWLFLGTDITVSIIQKEMIVAFACLIVLPLLAAFATEKWLEKKKNGKDGLDVFAWFPVPLLTLVVFSIAATQVNTILGATELLANLLLIFFAFLLFAGLLARLLAKAFTLPQHQGRTLAFSLGSRNSFVVLPLALSLPVSYELTVVVIVFQSLVELFGMAIYLWWVPGKLFPARDSQ